MANVIEILIHGTDAASAQIRGVQGSVAALGSSAAGLSSVLMGPVGLIIAFATAGSAALNLGNKLSDEVEQLRNMSARTGASINDLRALRQVMIEAGQSPDVLTQALTMANRNLALHSYELGRLGITAKTPIEAFFQLSDMVTKSGFAGRNAAAGYMLLGRSVGEMVPVMRNARDLVEDMNRRLPKLDEATIKAAGSWDTFMDHMKTGTKGFLDGVGALFLKYMDKVALLPGFLGGDIARAMGFGGPEKPPPLLAPPAPVPGRIGRVQMGGLGGIMDIDREALRETQRMQEEALARFRRAHGEIITLVESIAQGIESSLSQAFTGLINGMETFGQAIKTLFMGIADSVVSALAKIATSRLFIWLSGFLIPGGGSLGGLAGILRDIGKEIVGSGGPPLPRGGNSQTIIINTLDTRSLRMSAQFPGGSWARAQSELRIGTVY